MAAVGIANDINEALLNWLGGTAFPAAPSALYLALYTTMPTDDDGQGGTEVSVGGYSAQVLTLGALTTDGADGKRYRANSAAVVFGPFAAAPPNLVGWAVWKHATNRTAADFVGASTPFGTPEQILAGQTFTFPTGAARIKVD